MEPRFKLITSTTAELFEERLDHFIGTLGTDDIIVDIKFSTAVMGAGVAYSALVHYQQTESWHDD